MKLKRLFIAPHLLRKSFAITSPCKIAPVQLKGSINPCLKWGQGWGGGRHLPRHKGRTTQKQEEKCPLMYRG